MEWQPWCFVEIYVLMSLHRWENSFCLAAFIVVTALFFSYMNTTNYSIFSPPWGRLLAPGVFKPNCSTPFTLFLRLVSLQNTSVFSSLLIAYFYLTGHSPVFIYNTALLYIILLTLCVHCIPCRGRMGSWWLRSPVGSNTLLRPGLPLDGWLGWPDPINRLVVLCPNFD